MEVEELRERKVDELKLELKKAKEDLMKARFAKAADQLKNVADLRAKKKDVARIMTIIREKGDK